MEIRMIVVQYPQSYPGQYMPNVVDAWDEFTLEDNWEGYRESLKKYTDGVGTDYEAVREVIVTVPDNAITNLFQVPVVEGGVK